MRAFIALSVAALLLTACGQEAPGGADAPPPADAPAPVAPPVKESAFKGDFGMQGTEPFWSLEIKGDQLTLTKPEPPATVAKREAFVGDDREGHWEGKTSDGRTLVASLTVGECSDGMSDLKYPYKAEVKLGAEVLKGCGFKAGEQPREGE